MILFVIKGTIGLSTKEGLETVSGIKKQTNNIASIAN